MTLSNTSLVFHPKQREIALSPARFRVIRAGRKGGKTILETEDMISDAMAGRDRQVYYIAPNQTQARDIVWLTFRKRLSGPGKFNEQRLEIIVPTKEGGESMIKLSGWENRENFRGKSAYSLVFDETDTMLDFFVGWQEIFRPTLIDTGGRATFIGTPKKENPNLRRLEKIAKLDNDYACFHFNTFDNPFLPATEKDALIKEYKDNYEAYRQEIMGEHIENAGSLFKFDALMDMFTNTITKSNEKYLIVDIADDGSDKTIFNFWQGLESYKIDKYEHLNTDGIINQIRESASQERIPYSQIAVDAIGVGAGVASSPLLAGIIGFKSSYNALRTDIDPTRLPNVHYIKNAPLITEYKNLRSQCVFTLANLVNNHEIAVRNEDQRIKSQIIEELSTYQDASQGDGKRMATQKEDVKAIIGRSPDISDTLIMRMYFILRGKLSNEQSESSVRVKEIMRSQFATTERRQEMNNNR